MIEKYDSLGYTMSEDEGKEEYEEVQKSLSKRETVDIEYNVIKWIWA